MDYRRRTKRRRNTKRRNTKRRNTKRRNTKRRNTKRRRQKGGGEKPLTDNDLKKPTAKRIIKEFQVDGTAIDNGDFGVVKIGGKNITSLNLGDFKIRGIDGYPFRRPLEILYKGKKIDILLRYHKQTRAFIRDWEVAHVRIRNYIIPNIEPYETTELMFAEIQAEEPRNLYISIAGFFVGMNGEPLEKDKQLVCEYEDYITDTTVIVFDPIISETSDQFHIDDYDNRVSNRFYFSPMEVNIKTHSPDCNIKCECENEGGDGSSFCSIFEIIEDLIMKRLQAGFRVVIDSCLVNHLNTAAGPEFEGLSLSNLCYFRTLYDKLSEKLSEAQLDNFILIFLSGLYTEPITFSKFYEGDPPCVLDFKTAGGVIKNTRAENTHRQLSRL